MNSSRRFYIVSLGCPKNTVDSEGMAALLQRLGYHSTASPDDADFLIVNTCGFIGLSRQESIDVLGQIAKGKHPGQRLIAAGCYSQRSPNELSVLVPGIDGVIGTRRWMDIGMLVEQLDKQKDRPLGGKPVCHLPQVSVVGPEISGLHRVVVQGASAYLKLSDGCSRSCGFCAIPLIKGPTLSRPVGAILEDALWLADSGVREIILIAQDTTSYGQDLGKREGLTELLERLVATIPQVPWIRLMYAYPTQVTERLIQGMARHPQVLPYVDIPLQHAHPDTLRRMRRPSDVEKMRSTLDQLRAAMPEIAIRTTFLVGFPGETEMEFQALLNFVAEIEFDRVGIFTYSHEEGTPASRLMDDVPIEVKESRRRRLLEVQQPISLAKNQRWVGRTMDVLVEGKGDGLSVGRSFRDAPEIDGLVLVQGDLPVGEIMPVRVTGALEYDLVAEPE